MASILRVITRWSGFTGGPGYTVLHFRDFESGEGPNGGFSEAQALSAVTRVRAFFDTIKGFVPTVVVFDVLPEVEVIESTDGRLISAINVTPPAQVRGTGTGNYSAAAGAVVNWRTAGIRNGRRVRGRTFLVPLAVGAFSGTGELAPGTRTGIAAAAATLAEQGGSPDLGVYGRPSGPGATDGVWFGVTSSNVPALSAILTSRRD